MMILTEYNKITLIKYILVNLDNFVLLKPYVSTILMFLFIVVSILVYTLRLFTVP